MDYYHFKLYFPRDISDDEKKSVYEALLKNFKDRGQMDSYELLDVEYHDFIWQNRPKLYNWLKWIPKSWNNYGYEKGRVFGWTIFFLIILTAGTYQTIDHLTNSVYSIENVPQLQPLKKNKQSDYNFRIDWNRLWYAFIYTSTIFFLFSLKVEKIKFQNKRGVIYLMLMYTLGILCLAYMANFVLQK